MKRNAKGDLRKEYLRSDLGRGVRGKYLTLDRYTQSSETIHMKRTNIVIDETVVKEARRLTGLKTTREIVDAGLRELVARERRKRILELKGRIRWVGDLDAWRRDR